jgi:hypothetical protein
MRKLKTADHKANDDLRPDYNFDFSKSKPNRFAAKMKKGGRLVVLEPEVAAVFQDSDDVNKALRALVKAMPHRA